MHERRENIRTIDEFVDAFNAAFAGSPVLGTIAFDAASGDLRIPLRLNQRLVGLDAPIDLALGEGQAITLSTSAVGKLGVDVAAGFDIVLALGGERFEIALEGLHAQAGLALAVSDLEVAAQMGFLGLKAGGVGTGTGVSLDADVRFALDRDPDAETAGDTRFTLSQLGSTEALQAVRFDIDGTASARLKGLSVVGGKGASFAIAPELELSVTVPDLTDLGSAVVVLPDVADVGALFDLSKLSFGDIVEGLRFALATVADVVGEQPFYNQALPILDRSLGELLDLGDAFLGRIEAAGGTPAAALDEVEKIIEGALGIGPDFFDLTLGSTQLLIDIQLEAAYADDFALNLQLADLLAMAGAQVPEALYELVDVGGEARIGLEIGAALDLRIGLGLPGTSAPPVQLMDEGTEVRLEARLVAEDIDLRLKAGPFDIGIDSGSVVFDADGQVAETAGSSEAPAAAAVEAPASLTLRLENGAPKIETEGGFSINLPLTFVFGNRTLRLGDLSVATNPVYGSRGLEAFVRELANDAAFPRLGAADSLVVKLPDFDVFNVKPPSLLDVLYDPTPVLDGIDFALGSVQDVFGNTVVADLPLIGDKLAQVGGMVAEVRNGLLADLRGRLSEPGKTVEILRYALFTVFNDRLGILKDIDADGRVTLADIGIDFHDVEGDWLAAWAPGTVMPGEADSIRFDVDLGGRVLGTGIDIPLDLDLPGFELSVDGGFALEVLWNYDFGFGMSVQDGFFLTTNDDATPELRLDVAAYLDGSPQDPTVVTPFAGQGKLLFFEAAVTDRDLDPDAPGFQPSGLRGQLGIDLKGDRTTNRLTLTDLLSSPGTSLAADFSAAADLRLGVSLSALGLPALMADLVIDWDWDLADKTLRFPSIAIENLRLDFKSAVADFLLPIANTVADIVSPFRDVVYALTEPVSGLDMFTGKPRQALGLAPDPTLRGLIDVINELVRKAKPSLGLPRIDWSFLDAVKFALDMPDQLRTLLAFGAGMPLGSIYGLGTSDVRFVSSVEAPEACSPNS